MSDGDALYDVLCYGTISLDNITRLDHLPNPRRDAVARSEYNEVGGEALQVAIPLAIWGLRVLVAGNVIGTDWKSRFIAEKLARYPAIDTRYLRCRDDVVTPFARVLVTPDGERSRVTYWHDATPKVALDETMMRQARLLSVDAYGGAEREHAAAVASLAQQAHHLGRCNPSGFFAGKPQRRRDHFEHLAKGQLSRCVRV